MKTAKKTNRKQKVALNTQMNAFRNQISSNWHDMKNKLDKVLSSVDDEKLKHKK
ncbi:MAG: hypothetical protein J6M43_08445 [Neisseriaceae bacterium]|nr:hypothetical protein [Neisseriaceae bacterium]